MHSREPLMLSGRTRKSMPPSSAMSSDAGVGSLVPNTGSQLGLSRTARALTSVHLQQSATARAGPRIATYKVHDGRSGTTSKLARILNWTWPVRHPAHAVESGGGQHFRGKCVTRCLQRDGCKRNEPGAPAASEAGLATSRGEPGSTTSAESNAATAASERWYALGVARDSLLAASTVQLLLLEDPVEVLDVLPLATLGLGPLPLALVRHLVVSLEPEPGRDRLHSLRRVVGLTARRQSCAIS